VLNNKYTKNIYISMMSYSKIRKKGRSKEELDLIKHDRV